MSLSYRASGRSTTNGGTSKRRGSGHGLSQTRRPARVASPEPEEEEEIPENDDEEVDASFVGEDGAANGNRKALAKEVVPPTGETQFVDALGFESFGEELCAVCVGM